MPLSPKQQELCTTSPHDFSGLKAVFINCTLKPSPQLSHTEGLMTVAMEIMRANRVEVTLLRAVDHTIAPGVYPDMREQASGKTPGRRCGRPSSAPTSW